MLENRVNAIEGILKGIPDDTTVNLIVLYSGGFDSTALLDIAIRTKTELENVKNVYALHIESNLIHEGKLELEKEYTEKFISHINEDSNVDVKFLKVVRDIPDLDQYAEYAENSYDLLMVNTINSVVPFIGGAHLNIVLDGTLDRDSRVYHLPFYKDMVESFNKNFRKNEVWMEFPFLKIDKIRILSYIISKGLYEFCTCCEQPDLKEQFCYSCRDHTNALIELLLENEVYGGIHPAIYLDKKGIKFVKSELTRILGGEWN